MGSLIGRGVGSAEAWEAVTGPVPHIAAFRMREQPGSAGQLLLRTRSLGLILRGTCACLALAMVLKAPVYTADRIWKGLKVGVPHPRDSGDELEEADYCR